VSWVIDAQGLGKRYGKRWALKDCDLQIPSGHVVGLVGPNGAGKTTLLHLAVGLLAPTAGTVSVLGRPPAADPAQLARVGFVAQDTATYARLTVADHLRFGGQMNPGWDDALARERIADLDLDLDQTAGSLSGGQRAQLALTLAVAKRPQLLILDEPVASLDPLARRQFLEQLVELSTDARRAVVFSSHIVSDIERLANRIWILKEGQLYWQGELDSLKESIVRLHLQGAGTLPERLELPGLLSWRRHEGGATAIAKDWTDQHQQALQKQLDCSIKVESLGLEEIFLELHR
jgi:ABC-2 type transport system ATP-binding protein